MSAVDWLLDSDPAIRWQAKRDLTDAPAEELATERSKPDAEGRWPLENPHGSELVDARIRDLGFDMDEREGAPSLWNTLRALRVLRWSESAARDSQPRTRRRQRSCPVPLLLRRARAFRGVWPASALLGLTCRWTRMLALPSDHLTGGHAHVPQRLLD